MSEADIHEWIESRSSAATCKAMSEKFAAQQEVIDKPDRYGGDTCMNAIAAMLSPEELRGFIKGTAMRYLWREQHKGGDQDLKKIQWYLNWYLEKDEA